MFLVDIQQKMSILHHIYSSLPQLQCITLCIRFLEL